MSLCPCYILGVKCGVQIFVKKLCPSRTALLHMDSISASAHCSVDVSAVSAEQCKFRKFLKKMFESNENAVCSFKVFPLTADHSGPQNSKIPDLTFQAVLLPSGTHSGVLLVSPTTNGDIPLDDRVTSPISANYVQDVSRAPHNSQPLTSTLGQRNLRRHRTMLASVSSPIVNGIASGMQSGTGPINSASPKMWLKENATSIGDSPLTSPSRESEVENAHGSSAGPASSGHQPFPFVKSPSCPSFTAPTSVKESSHLGTDKKDVCDKDNVMNGYDNKADGVVGHQIGSSPDMNLVPYSPNTVAALSPCGDSGSRSIFSELVIDCKQKSSRLSSFKNDTILEYSNCDEESTVENANQNEAVVSSPKGGDKMGLFSSVMLAAGALPAPQSSCTSGSYSHSRLQAPCSDEPGELNSVAKGVQSETTTSNEPQLQEAETRSHQVRNCANQFKKVHAISLASIAGTPKEATLLELIVECIFLGGMTPVACARQLVLHSYESVAGKQKKSKETLKERMKIVRLLSKAVLLEVDSPRDSISGVNDLVSASVASQRKLTKLVACLLYIFLNLEHEQHVMSMSSKQKQHVKTKPPLKGLSRCMRKLKLCFEMKKYQNMPPEVTDWLISDNGRCFRLLENTCSEDPSAPGDILNRDNDIQTDVYQKIITSMRNRYRLTLVDSFVGAEDDVELDEEQSTESPSKTHSADKYQQSRHGGDTRNIETSSKKLIELSTLAQESGPSLSDFSQIPIGDIFPVTATTKRKNSLVSARKALNGHRTLLEDRLRSQQNQITYSASSGSKDAPSRCRQSKTHANSKQVNQAREMAGISSCSTPRSQSKSRKSSLFGGEKRIPPRPDGRRASQRIIEGTPALKKRRRDEIIAATPLPEPNATVQTPIQHKQRRKSAEIIASTPF